ncbi:hypothetical protein SVIO_001360 [Streptomyces violaceusniger]|uniref:Ornithine cyclodeaminase n=1 Tax=Streptomyces violaceusniger TaxID=68280 RepID=A0A4D4KUJ6_STRVO|nr:hypothetical protein SVIO_001360 [Streptomyces violaceusniger]
MLNIDAQQTITALPFHDLIPALRQGFVHGASTPARHHHTVDADTDATLLLMPAWSHGEFLGVKLVNVFPANGLHGRPALSSAFVLASAATGEHLAIIDGNELTRRRTVATSALAATYLARPESTTHLVVGAGHVGSLVAEAYRSVFDIRTVLVHDRSSGHAHRLADTLNQQGLDARAVADLAPRPPKPTSSAVPPSPPSQSSRATGWNPAPTSTSSAASAPPCERLTTSAYAAAPFSSTRHRRCTNPVI